MSLMPPRKSCTRPRRREIGESVLSSALAANVPSATMTRGPDEIDLAVEERLAGRDLVRLRIPVLRRPALDDVGDVDVRALELNGLDDLREQLPGASDERLAEAVLVGARRLAHEHQFRLRIADAEDDLAAALLAQLAARAGGADVRAECVQASRAGSMTPPRQGQWPPRRFERPPPREATGAGGATGAGSPSRSRHAASRETPVTPSSRRNCRWAAISCRLIATPRAPATQPGAARRDR